MTSVVEFLLTLAIIIDEVKPENKKPQTLVWGFLLKLK